MRSSERCSTSETSHMLWVLTARSGGSGDPRGVGVQDLNETRGKDEASEAMGRSE